MSEIGQAYVRIRPNVSGFRGETEGGVKQALGQIARVAAPILGAVGAFEFGKNAVKEAASETTALSLVRQAVLNTDKAWTQHGQNVGEILQQQSRDTGFGLSEQVQAFQRLESGTQNTAKSLKDLGLAQDLARGRHIGLAQAAGLVAKAEQGSDGAFRRLGIIIPPITSHVQKLRLEHAEAVKTGVKFDAISKEQYKTALAQAAALDKQATRTHNLAEIQRRFRGDSKTFAEGPAGEFARLRENIAQFEASLGRDLLPTLNDGAVTVRKYVDELRTSDTVHHVVSDSVHLFSSAIDAGKQAVEFFLPPLRAVGGVLENIGHFAGVGGVLAFAAGFKAISAGVEVAGRVQEKYRAIVAAGAQVEQGRAAILAREAAAYNTLSVAVERNSLAIDGNIASQAAGGASVERNLLPRLANVSQVVEATADTSRLASEDIANATSGFGAAAAEAGEGALSSADSLTSLSDHSVNLAKDVGAATRSVRILGKDFAIARVGAETFAAGLTATQTAQLAQAGVTAEQVAALDRYLVATESTLGAQRAQAIATEGQSAALAENVVALSADTDALIANRAANIGAAEGAALNAAANTASATAKTATAAEGLAGTLGRVGKGLFTLAGGYRTVAGLGLAALVFGIYKGVTAETGLERATHRLDDSLDELGSHLSRTTELAHSYATAVSNIKSDKVAVDVAKANVALAKQAFATSDAKRGSAEYLSVQTQLASAQDSLRRAEEQLTEERRRASALALQRRNEEDEVRQSLDKSIDRISELRRATGAANEGEASAQEIRSLRFRLGISATQARVQAGLNHATKDFAAALREEAEAQHNPELRTRIALLEGLTSATGKVPTLVQMAVILRSNAKEGIQQIVGELERARPKAEQFANQLRAERFAIQGANPALANRIGLLLQYTRTVGRIPTKHETEIALKTPKLNDAVTGLGKILGQMDGLAARSGFKSGKDFAENFIQTLLASGVLDAFNALLGGAAGVAGASGKRVADISKAELTAARADIGATNRTIKQVRDNISEARQALSDAQRSLADANRDVADAIRQGTIDIRNSVSQAGANLFSIGSSLSDAIDEFLDAKAKTETVLHGPPEREALRLRNSIASGEAGPDVARHAQALASQIEQQQVVEKDEADKQKERSRRQISDLVAQFNKGTITISTFNKRLAGILAKDGFSYKEAGRTLGIAFSDGFRAQVQGLKKQAKALAAGPFLPGISALAPQIVSPLQQLRQTQRDIADTQRRRDDARLEVQKDSRHLHALQENHGRLLVQEGRQQVRLQRLMEQHLRFLRQKSKEQTALLRTSTLGPSGEGHTRRPDRRRPRALEGSRVGAATG